MGESEHDKKEANEIQEVLLEIGISPSVTGFEYMTYAEHLILENPEYLRNITKSLYVDVARHFHTKPQSVERCIRHAINAGWSTGSPYYINKLFKNSINPAKGTPTNTQFLARVYFFLANRA